MKAEEIKNYLEAQEKYIDLKIRYIHLDKNDITQHYELSELNNAKSDMDAYFMILINGLKSN